MTRTNRLHTLHATHDQSNPKKQPTCAQRQKNLVFVFGRSSVSQQYYLILRHWHQHDQTSSCKQQWCHAVNSLAVYRSSHLALYHALYVVRGGFGPR